LGLAIFCSFHEHSFPIGIANFLGQITIWGTKNNRKEKAKREGMPGF